MSDSQGTYASGEAHVVLIGSIDVTLAERMLGFLREKVPEDCPRIHLAIQSPGGSVPVALALANILQALPCPVTTYNIGNVDSAATILFAAGSERVCAPGARFLLHPIKKSVEGYHTLDTLSSLIKEITEDTRRVTELLAQRTGRTAPSRWEELMSAPHSLSSEAAVELGLAHRIDECRRALAWDTCCGNQVWRSEGVPE